MKTVTSTLDMPVFSYQFPQQPEDILFFDIETTGLSPKASSLYLIGAMYYNQEDRCYQLTQWFADDYQSEASILTSFFTLLEQYQYLYHFNGKNFDIPYILEKCRKHNLIPSEHCSRILLDSDGVYSIDLLVHVRSIKKHLGIKSARQTALEHWLGIQREDQYDGGSLIPVYTKYMQAKILHPAQSEELLHLLLLHNHDDMKGMLEVVSILNYRRLFLEDATEFCRPDTVTLNDEGQIVLNFTHNLPLPRPVSLNLPYPSGKSDTTGEITATLLLDGTTGQLLLPLYQGNLYHFYENYNDYFYLPSLDTAIHKSLVSNFPKETRKKATRANCYQKQEGFFLPVFGPLADCPVNYYQLSPKDKSRFLLLRPQNLILDDDATRHLWCQITANALHL